MISLQRVDEATVKPQKYVLPIAGQTVLKAFIPFPTVVFPSGRLWPVSRSVKSMSLVTLSLATSMCRQ